jgi:hypothetical protein
MKPIDVARCAEVFASATVLVALAAGCVSTHASVWVDNRSSHPVAFFVTDLSDQPAAWFVAPANSKAHTGSAGLHISDAVRVNVEGWRTEECSPGDYDDTLYDVSRFDSVELLVDETGRPSVAVAPEPPGLPALEAFPDERC